MAGTQQSATGWNPVPIDEYHLPHHIVHGENSSEEYLPQHYDASPGAAATATDKDASGWQGLQETYSAGTGAAGGGAAAGGAGMSYGRSSPDLKTAEDQIRANHRTRVLTEKRGSRRNNRKYLILLIVAAIVVIVALAVGLGVGLSRSKSSQSGQSDLPGSGGTSQTGGPIVIPPGQDDGESGMQESGLYTTSYNSTTESLVWTPTNVTFSGNASSPSVNISITINPSQTGATIDGFGASLTDSSAYLLTQLKSSSPTLYNETMHYLFNQRIGLSIVRVPIGTTDFSPESHQYTFADKIGMVQSETDWDAYLTNFNTYGASTYIFPVLKDALAINPALKISILPWSPPSWMKDSNSVNGGSLINGAGPLLAEYLAKSAQAFKTALGVTPWGLAVQNEPSHQALYPSMNMTNAVESIVLAALRGRLGEMGMGSIKLWAHEDNFDLWSQAAQLVMSNSSMLDGASFHCYNGSYSVIPGFIQAVGGAGAGKTLSMSECSGQDTGESQVSSYTWWMNNIFMPLTQYDFSSIIVWNIALDQNNGPHLSSAYCDNCRGILTVDGTAVNGNVQATMLSHMSAVSSDLSRFGGGPAVRLNTTVSNATSACITARTFAAPWTAGNTSGQRRYGLVVQNSCADANLTVVMNSAMTNVTAPYGLTSLVWTA